MRLYVETNFILELAFLRGEHQACAELLAHAEARRIDLHLPAFSVAETYDAWIRRARQRGELGSRLKSEVAELSRSLPYRGSAKEFREVSDLLTRSSKEEQERVDVTLAQVLQVARLIPIEPRTLRRAREFQEQELKLSPQDLIVYASVMCHLEEAATSEPLHGFVTRNTRDFAEPEVRRSLSFRGCRLFTSFVDTLGALGRL
jgi:predicted nucleic acid-binding protein